MIRLNYISVSFLSLVIILCSSFKVSTFSNKQYQSPAKITTDSFKYDFGDIIQGETITHVFKFTNSGDRVLFILDTKSTCGCTIPEIPKEPIKPGEEGLIKVKFNSVYKKGEINKVISISANTYPNTITKFYITGNLIIPKN